MPGRPVRHLHPVARKSNPNTSVATTDVFGENARTMRTLEAKAPDLLLHQVNQVRDLADKQKVIVDLIVSAALAR